MREPERTTIPAALMAMAAALVLGGCGGDDQTAVEPTTAATPSTQAAPPPGDPADTERPAPQSEVGEDGGPAYGVQRPAQPPREVKDRASAEAERTYTDYIEAINERDGKALCDLLPPGAERSLQPPVRSGDCPRRLGGSIGYRDPRGFPVWKQTTLSGIEGTNVSRNLDSARVTASIVTEFADRSEPSVESDIAYLELSGGDWRLAKPSAALYRAIGRPELPPTVISPP